MKLTKLILENWMEETPSYSEEDRSKFLEEVAAYNQYGKSIYQEKDSNYVDLAKKLHEMAKVAEHVAMNEQENTFDKITVKRNMTELKKLALEFAKVSTEGQGLRDRMASLYEDMGHIYHRYFEVKDLDGDGVPDTVRAKEQPKSEEPDPMMYQEDVPGKSERRAAPPTHRPTQFTAKTEAGSARHGNGPGETEIEFDKDRFMRLVRKDRFLSHVMKGMGRKMNPEVAFNTYVIDDSQMERAYLNA